MPNTVKNSISQSGELLLYGEIGDWMDDLDAESVVKQLEQLNPKNITVRIHSGGGLILDGLAIYNRLKQSKAHVTVYIDGLAASIASVIAMAGDTVIMPENSWLMIHKPWNIVAGDAEDLRKTADTLDGFEDTLINIYQSKTGLDADKIKNYLKEETWLNAKNAKELGFIDEIVEDIKAAASISLNAFNNIPGTLKNLMGGNTMPEEEIDSQAQDLIKAERVRIAEIQSIGSKAKLSESQIKEFINEGTSLDEVRKVALDAMNQIPKPRYHSNKLPENDFYNPLNRIRAYSEALACRHTNIKPSDEARQYMGKGIPDMARDILESRIGLNTSNMSNQTVLAKAMHTTSDFPELLQGAGERILRSSYMSVPSVIKQIARQNVARDFRALTSINLGEAPELEQVNEAGEFTYGSLVEAKETYSLSTYGKIFHISRQALINDDLGAFTDMNVRLGKASAEFEGKFLLNKILSNPTMDDGNTLFHANHKNLGTAGALSKTTLTEARKMMRKQVGLDGKTPIDATPAYLLVPAALETDAEELLATLYPATTDNVNPFSGSLKLLVDPRLDANSETAWYLFSDPSLITVLEYAYLESEQGPVVITESGFDVDGVKLKVRFDLGAGVLDHRGAFKNAGA